MMNEEVTPTMSLDLAYATLKEYTERPPHCDADRYWFALAKHVIRTWKTKEPVKESVDVG